MGMEPEGGGDYSQWGGLGIWTRMGPRDLRVGKTLPGGQIVSQRGRVAGRGQRPAGFPSAPATQVGGTRLPELDTGICLCFQLEGKCHKSCPLPTPPASVPRLCPSRHQQASYGVPSASACLQEPLVHLSPIPPRHITGVDVGDKSRAYPRLVWGR